MALGCEWLGVDGCEWEWMGVDESGWEHGLVQPKSNSV